MALFVCLTVTVLGLVFWLRILVDSMENAYSAVKSIGTKLQEQLRVTVDKQFRQDIKYLIGKVDRIEPATAAGYFTIDRSCLLGMLSVRSE